MAIRRAKQKAQVIALLQQQAPPGEQFIACVHCETGPGMWATTLLDELPLVGLIIALTRKYYFLTLTNTSIVLNTANRWNNRPGPIVASWPRDSFPVSRVKRAFTWSSMYVQFSGQAKPTRLNVHRYWRVEFDQLFAALPQQTQQAVTEPGDQPQAS
jgi:hypothetical protein